MRRSTHESRSTHENRFMHENGSTHQRSRASNLGQRDLRRRHLAAPEHGGRLQAGSLPVYSGALLSGRCAHPASIGTGGSFCYGWFPHSGAVCTPTGTHRSWKNASSMQDDGVCARRLRRPEKPPFICPRSPLRTITPHICITRIRVPGTSYPFGPSIMQNAPSSR